MKVSVIVPTYKRVKDLNRCLTALSEQSCCPSEIVVVVRDSDQETIRFLEIFENSSFIRKVFVSEPGQVSALNCGLRETSGDIIAITDDDAAPHPSWLKRIQDHFDADDDLGGVGGRDFVFHGSVLEDGMQSTVGKVSWFGRVIGNHHLGVGPAREVEVLKGANMSYRRKAVEGIKFNQNLLGSGAQVHNDLAFSLTVKKKGWKLIYDPDVAVDHYPAKRFDEDQRDSYNPIALFNQVHNETVCILSYLNPTRRLMFIIWSVFIGSRNSWGLAQSIRFLPDEGSRVLEKLAVSLKGRWIGWKTWQKSSTLDNP